jgi:hypothetical protein
MICHRSLAMSWPWRRFERTVGPRQAAVLSPVNFGELAGLDEPGLAAGSSKAHHRPLTVRDRLLIDPGALGET